MSIDSRCSWHGWVERDKAIGIAKRGHVMVITSLLDLTSTVSLEALSLGLPVICLDHCGFADVVTPDCGIKIPVTTPKQVSIDIARAIESLWNDETYRRRLCAGAIKRAADFSWNKKMEVLNSVYADLTT